MKRLVRYLILFLCSIVYASCSLKHKWQNKQQEKFNHSKKEHLQHLLRSEHLVLDTNLHFSHTQLQNYRLWTLSGNVQIYSNGSFQTDHAILQTWHNETDSQQTSSSKTTYQNQSVEETSITEEAINLNKKSTQKEKWKFTTNLWWLTLLLIPLGLWRFRKWRSIYHN